jgi:ubiquinone/menaquinone biosynthesis C-methylase UbiE
MTEAGVQPDPHDAFDRIEEQFNEALDASLGPLGPDALYRYVAEMELPAGATCVDVGCGRGEHALQLARRFSLRVTGIDPTARRMAVARGEAQAADHVQFVTGTAESLPVTNTSVDLIWCRDVLCLVEDLDRAYQEVRRILKPGGRALIYQMYATDRPRHAKPTSSSRPWAAHSPPCDPRTPSPPSIARACGSTAV